LLKYEESGKGSGAGVWVEGVCSGSSARYRKAEGGSVKGAMTRGVRRSESTYEGTRGGVSIEDHRLPEVIEGEGWGERTAAGGKR